MVKVKQIGNRCRAHCRAQRAMLAVLRRCFDLMRLAVGIDHKLLDAGRRTDFLRQTTFFGHLRVREHRRTGLQHGNGEYGEEEFEAAKEVHGADSNASFCESLQHVSRKVFRF